MSVDSAGVAAPSARGSAHLEGLIAEVGELLRMLRYEVSDAVVLPWLARIGDLSLARLDLSWAEEGSRLALAVRSDRRVAVRGYRDHRSYRPSTAVLGERRPKRDLSGLLRGADHYSDAASVASLRALIADRRRLGADRYRDLLDRALEHSDAYSGALHPSLAVPLVLEPRELASESAVASERAVLTALLEGAPVEWALRRHGSPGPR